ncbi:DUF6415 family natural product biosynthesis protein [Streptomyces sp. NPDC051452]|uniref:DUF6415 family natural product biosynthesis protein n=1 Tax=Streptomyces sp. NPDC051452 TaxID=3365654 RepID=UPI003798F36A
MTRAAANPAAGRIDTAPMLETAAQLLGPDDGPDVLPPVAPELETLTALLRTHLGLLIPAVEAQAQQTDADSIPKFCALACVGEATRKLRIGDGCTPDVRVAVARKLARCVRALCDHYEQLGGGNR